MLATRIATIKYRHCTVDTIIHIFVEKHLKDRQNKVQVARKKQPKVGGNEMPNPTIKHSKGIK